MDPKGEFPRVVRSSDAAERESEIAFNWGVGGCLVGLFVGCVVGVLALFVTLVLSGVVVLKG